MTLKEVFPVSEIFDPEIYYDGEIHLGDSVHKENELLLNAIQNKKSNAYMEFLEKNYYKYMRELFEPNSMDLKFSVAVRLGYNKKTDKRGIRFSYVNYLVEKLFANKINGVDFSGFNNAIEENKSDEEIIEEARKIVIETKKRFQDILKNGQKSPYFNDVIEDLVKHQINYRSKETLNYYLKRGITILNNFLNIIKIKLYSFFDKQINLDEFLNCFSYDKLCIVIMYEYLKTLICEEDKVSTSLLRVVMHYAEAVKIVRKTDHSYNPSAVVNLWGSNKNKLIDANAILKGLDEYLKFNPDIIVPDLNSAKIKSILKNFGYRESEIEAFNPQTRTDAYKLDELIKRMKEEELLFAKWEFLPKGKKREENISKGSYYSYNKTIDTSEFIRKFRIVRNYIEGSNYLYTVEGKDTFLGYIAYLYPNGKVIFMRDYTKLKTRKEMETSAIYAMNFKDFLSLSKLTKQELINLISSAPEYGIRRIYHFKNMDRTINILESCILGDDYSEEVKLFINRLVTNGELERNL